MDAPSSFQRLPKRAVERIIRIVAGNTYPVLALCDQEVPRSSLKCLFPLFFIGETWHRVALKLLCRNVVLQLDTTRSAIPAGLAALPTGLSLPAITISPLVQAVTLSIANWPDVFDGMALLVLSSFIRGGLVFPAARRVCIKLLPLPAPKSTPSTDWTTGYELVFARRVLTLAPAFTALSLEFGGSRPDTHLTLLHQTLLTELLVGADKYALSDTYTVAYVNDFPIVPGNLVRLFFRGAALSLFHEALIRRNALSLESLVVTMAIVDTSCWMFNSSADSLAIYPLLKYLRVSFPSNVDNYGWPHISDLVPFPKLAALHMNGYYPFKDGVFFRGNRFSLRYVTLPFNMLVRDIIGNNDVFAYDHSNCLRCITISAVARQDTIDLSIGGTRNIDQQLSQIAASASRLVYRPGNAARKDLIRAFSFQHGFERLEHLELSNRPMAVRDVADLLSCLPGLSSLNCNLCKNVFTADRVDVNEWLGKSYSRIYPLNRRFKSWTTQPSQGMALRHFARGVMLIAVLCPSFYFVRMQQAIRAAFNREAAWATFTVPFKKYAARLRDIVLRVGIADGVASDAGMESDL